MNIRKVPVAKNRKVLSALHTLTFPGDHQPRWRIDGVAWIVYDSDEPVAFLYAEPLDADHWYFSRVGVMPAARGRGLQGELMAALELWAQRRGLASLVSSTYLNPASANNFVRRQWMTYLPQYAWGADNTIYWRKVFRASE